MEFWTGTRQVDEDFAGSVREFLEGNYPVDDSNPYGRFEREYNREFQMKLIAWQREHLAGATAGQRAAFRRELERFGIGTSSANPNNMISRVLEMIGTEDQKEYYLERLGNGDFKIALGFTEPDSGSDVAAAKTRAVRDGDEWVINGSKMFTSGADTASHVFLLTRTNTEVPKHRGLTVFLVPADSPGLVAQRIGTLGYHSTCLTFYSEVRVSDSARVGDVDGGWSVMRKALDIEHGAGEVSLDGGETARRVATEQADVGLREGPALGRGQRETGGLLRRTASWAANARDDSGDRRIDDPVVRETLARLAVWDEISRLIARRNDPLRLQPGVGNGTKLWWTELYLRAANECMDIVGAEALLPFTDEGAVEEGAIEHGFRASPITTIFGGVSEVHLDVIAERRLGLPKTRGKR